MFEAMSRKQGSKVNGVDCQQLEASACHVSGFGVGAPSTQANKYKLLNAVRVKARGHIR
jgi:hypothetical protein